MENLFKDKKFYNTLLKVALPIVIQNFIASSLNMVDTVMIGMVGEKELAAVGIANQYFFLFNLLIVGILSGCSVFISQFWGKKDETNIKKVVAFGGVIVLVIATIFTIIASIAPEGIIGIFSKDSEVIKLGSEYLIVVVISYIFTAITFNFAFSLRCVEKAVQPMKISAVALLINTCLNYIFIFGHLGFKPMGVTGAALATLIARVIESILILRCVYKKERIIAAKLKDLISITKEFYYKLIKTVIPVVLNETCWGVGFVAYSVVYGRIGTEAIAAVQICNTIQNLFLVITFGMANAAAVMVGHKIGANNEEQGKVYAKKFLLLGLAMGAILSVSIALTSPYILSFFKVSQGVLITAQKILYIISAIFTIRMFNIILIVGVLRGGGDAKFALIAEAITMWLIGVPLSFIGAFVIKLRVEQVVALLTFEEVLKFMVGIIRIRSGKWVKNLVHNM